MFAVCLQDSDGDGLSDQEIQDEVDTFMFAGHDSTSSSLSWCLYNLAKHPQQQQRCREEITALMKGEQHLTWYVSSGPVAPAPRLSLDRLQVSRFVHITLR